MDTNAVSKQHSGGCVTIITAISSVMYYELDCVIRRIKESSLKEQSVIPSGSKRKVVSIHYFVTLKISTRLRREEESDTRVSYSY